MSEFDPKMSEIQKSLNYPKRKITRESDSSQDIQKNEKVIFWDKFCGYGEM